MRLLFDSLNSSLETAFRVGNHGVEEAEAGGDAARTVIQLGALNDVLVAASTQSAAAIDLAVEPTPSTSASSRSPN